MLRVGQRLKAELTAAEGAQRAFVERDHHRSDSGFVRHCDGELGRNFEIIAGRVLAEDGSQRSVAFVRTIDAHSRT